MRTHPPNRRAHHSNFRPGMAGAWYMAGFVLVWVSSAIQLDSVAERAFMRENSNQISSGFIADVKVFVIVLLFVKEN